MTTLAFNSMKTAPIDGRRVILLCQGHNGGQYVREAFYRPGDSYWNEGWEPYCGDFTIYSTEKLDPLGWLSIEVFGNKSEERYRPRRKVTGGYHISYDGRFITHPKCGMKSHNKNDIEQKYCGYCNEFMEELIKSTYAEHNRSVR